MQQAGRPRAIMKTQAKLPRNFSMEFFPPNTPEGKEKLRATAAELALLEQRDCGKPTKQAKADAVAVCRLEGADGALLPIDTLRQTYLLATQV